MKLILGIIVGLSMLIPSKAFAVGATALDPDWCEKPVLQSFSRARQTPVRDFGTIFSNCVNDLVRKAEKGRDNNCDPICGPSAPAIISEANKIKVLIASSGETVDYKTFSRMRILLDDKPPRKSAYK